jgi:four helix bundle protein
MFDHEKLEVYQHELQFIAWATDLLDKVKRIVPAKTREVRSQLDRASVSIVLNTAEGNSKRYPQLRSKFFDDARGSAMECAACLDVLVAMRVCTVERMREGKEVAVFYCPDAHEAGRHQRRPGACPRIGRDIPFI